MSLESHLTPDDNILSYGKMIKFVKHQMNIISTEMKKVEQDTLYYVLHDEETLKNYSHYQTALEQWEFLLECLECRYELLTF